MGKYVCFLAVCVVMLSSCYNDDDLKNSISGLEDRMDKLEASLQSVQTDISTLKTLTDALSQNKSIASVLENEDGSYTIKFSDKTEVTIRNGEDGEDAPKITVIKNEEDGIYYWGITSTDGKKTFLKDGEGKMMPVTAAAPKIRINTNTKEWEISTDSGKTWESTGVYASGEGTGAVIVSPFPVSETFQPSGFVTVYFEIPLISTEISFSSPFAKYCFPDNISHFNSLDFDNFNEWYRNVLFGSAGN